MGRQAAEQVRPEHRRDHRPVAAAALAGDPAMLAGRERSEPPVDPGHDLVAQVRVIAAGPRRVEELAAAELVQQSTNTTIAGGGASPVSPAEQGVDASGVVDPEGRPVGPHVELAGHPLDEVDRRRTAGPARRRRPAAGRPRPAGRTGRRAGCRAGPRSRRRDDSIRPRNARPHGRTVGEVTVVAGDQPLRSRIGPRGRRRRRRRTRTSPGRPSGPGTGGRRCSRRRRRARARSRPSRRAGRRPPPGSTRPR